jgi:hypothetical protein
MNDLTSLRVVAAGVSAAVEPGIVPGEVNPRDFELLVVISPLRSQPGGGTPPFTAGETPAATTVNA